MGIFDRLFGSSKERTLEDIRRDQETILRKQLREDQRRHSEWEVAQRRQEAEHRRAEEEGAQVRALLVGSPLPEVAEALEWSVKISAYGDTATLAAERHTSKRRWYIEVKADGSGTIYASGWKKRLHLRGMTVARAERLIRDAAKHATVVEHHGAPHGVTRH